MKYMNRTKRDDVIRNYDIDMAIEEYLSEQRQHVYELLDEIEMYPAGLQKTLFNYKLNYDEEQEMFSREIIHMYRTGATDPQNLLATMMREAAKHLYSDSEDEKEGAGDKNPKRKHGPPNLSCFKKKEDDAAAN